MLQKSIRWYGCRRRRRHDQVQSRRPDAAAACRTGRAWLCARRRRAGIGKGRGALCGRNNPRSCRPDRSGRSRRSDLANIDHVKIVRLHTRIPVADPARVTDQMVAALKVEGATTWVALHANHPRELTNNARAACARLIDAGNPMVSQSVLLRGVNDDAETLEALMRAFVECRIKPYSLHHGDRAPGTAPLRTTLAQGRQLMGALRRRDSG